MGKGDALDRGKYRGLKLTEQAMKGIERIAVSLIRQVVSSLLTIPSLVLFQAEAQQMQSLSSTSCRRNIILKASGFIRLSWIC